MTADLWAALDTLLSYSLADLLLFSPEAYWQLLADFVPAQSQALPLLAIASLASLAGLYQVRLYGAGLAAQALLWFYCGWQFYGRHYLTLNPLLAPPLAWICYGQAALALGLSVGHCFAKGSSAAVGDNGFSLLAAAIALLLIKPLLDDPTTDHIVQQLPGLLPAPTALFSLLLACGLPARARGLLLPLALLILVVECITLKLLGTPLWWHNALAGLLLLLLAAWQAAARRGSTNGVDAPPEQ